MHELKKEWYEMRQISKSDELEVDTSKNELKYVGCERLIVWKMYDKKEWNMKQEKCK